jgi:D-3-phosphoglycerate dehydrogenase / 2-oxoglutarate reductase
LATEHRALSLGRYVVVMSEDAAAPVFFFDRMVPDEVAALVEGRAVVVGPDDVDLARAEVVIAGSRGWDGPAMDLAPRLRVISRIGVGYDTVDVAAATARGVAVCIAPDAPTVSTAEHTVALLLAVTKDIDGWASRSSVTEAGAPPGVELDGRTLGLFGFGRIARRVAAVGRALGMHTIAHDPFVAAAGQDVTFVGVDELWRRSDVVSLHAPATPSTHHVVDAAALAAMRPGSFLINCARGSLIDHDALLDALERGHLAGAGLDVTEPEPLPADHALRRQPRVVITPHIASHTAVGRLRLYAHATDNAFAVLAGDRGCRVPEQCTPAEGSTP